MRKTYPSDISREQFEQITDLLETARKKTRPRTVDLSDVFCAILCLLNSGCPYPQGINGGCCPATSRSTQRA